MNTRFKYITLFLISFGKLFAQNANKCKNIETTTTIGSKVQQQIFRKYDRFNNLIEEEYKLYFTENPVSKKIVYEYGQNKKLIKTTKFLENKETSSVSHNYDNVGNLVSETASNKKGTLSSDIKTQDLEESINYYENGSVASSEKTKFSKGKKIEISKFNDQNKLTSIQKFEYNNQGFETYKSINDVLGSVLIENRIQYNTQNKPTSIEEYLNGKINSTLKLEYDNFGKLNTRTKVDKNNKEEYRVEYTYNILNLEIESRQYYQGKAVNLIEKKYDEKNNLILETTFNNLGQKISETTYKFNCI